MFKHQSFGVNFQVTACMHILLQFYLFKSYLVSLQAFGCIATLLNATINRLQMGVSVILQSCIGKHKLMAKRTFSIHYLSLYKVF